MQAPLRSSSIEADRRRDPRVHGAVGARLVIAGRTPSPAHLTDVSRQGCCARTDADWLRPGRFTAIVLPGHAPLKCVVRWTRAGIAGLELLRPITDDRADWLALID